MNGDRSTPVLLVLAGPPCSGKSVISRQCGDALSATRFAMDEIRQEIMPTAKNTAHDRDIAYSVMHGGVARALRHSKLVIVDATYARASQRRALATIAQEVENITVFLVELHVDPDEAEKRFKNRSGKHPAVDLTAERVHKLAESYPFSAVPLGIDTTNASPAKVVAQVLHFLSDGQPVGDITKWVAAGIQVTPGQRNP